MWYCHRMTITTCLVGSFSSGKSTLLKRYLLKNEFKNYKMQPQPTIGMSSFENHTVIDTTQLKNIIFDTAGQERYSSLIPIYLRNCDILIFTIDSTDYNASVKYFKSIISDIIDLNKYIVVCYTKCDTSRILENDRVKEIHHILSAHKKQYKIIYTSSFTGKNVDLAFTFFLKQAFVDANISAFDKIVEVTNEEPNGCCILS